MWTLAEYCRRAADDVYTMEWLQHPHIPIAVDVRSQRTAPASHSDIPVATPQAALIEYNMSVVDAAIDALNAALARGLDWRDLAALIENEKVTRKHAPPQMIQPLHCNQVTCDSSVQRRQSTTCAQPGFRARFCLTK